jgi:hypothetical protein
MALSFCAKLKLRRQLQWEEKHSRQALEPGLLLTVSYFLRRQVIAQSTLRLSMIVKVKEGYQVLSEKGKNLGGPYKTLEEANKRLKQVEFFKHNKAKTLPKR